MAWSRNQIITLQMYKRAAQLADQEYRQILRENTGATSSREPTLTQYDYDKLMPAIEVRLAYRVANKIVPHPIMRGKPVKLGYWRARCPGGGAANTRQLHKILADLWPRLEVFLPQHQRNMDYLRSIAAQACGYHVRHIHDLKAWQAHCLLEALKDRLHYATRTPVTVEDAEPESEYTVTEIPF